MTHYIVILLPVILPVVFWAAYHLHMDRHLPEPPGHLLLAFALGVGSFWVGLLGYRALGLVGLRYDAFALGAEHLPGLFAYAVLAIGVIEESAKLLPIAAGLIAGLWIWRLCLIRDLHATYIQDPAKEPAE